MFVSFKHKEKIPSWSQKKAGIKKINVKNCPSFSEDARVEVVCSKRFI